MARDVTLGALHSNAGLRVAYTRRLVDLVDELHQSLSYWIQASYRRNTPEMAQDDAPSDRLQREMDELRSRWTKRFDEASILLGTWFAKRAQSRSEAALKGVLRRGGFSVKFNPSSGMQDALAATINAQVALIRSIGEQHLSQVAELVMRSAMEGRNVGWLATQLRERYGITRKRARNIALHQNNMATAVFTRVRQKELGINRARWLHSTIKAKGRFRPDHVAFSKGRYDGPNPGPIYNVDEGVELREGLCWPGTLINCHCVSRPIIEALGVR